MGSPARLRKTRSLTFSGRGEGAFRIEVKSAMEVLRVALTSTIDPVHPIHASRASRPYPTPAPWLPAANFVAETRGAFKGFELSPDHRARCTFGRSSWCSHRTVSSVTQSVYCIFHLRPFPQWHPSVVFRSARGCRRHFHSFHRCQQSAITPLRFAFDPHAFPREPLNFSPPPGSTFAA